MNSSKNEIMNLRKLLFLFITLSFTNTLLRSQVYPYSIDVKENGKTTSKYGLITEEKVKVTEPTFDFIEPFKRNNEYDFTLYYIFDVKGPAQYYDGSIRNDVRGKEKKGLIDSRGKLWFEEFNDKSLTYDGNGVIARLYKGDSLKIINLQSKKLIFSQEKTEFIDLLKDDKKYYILIKNTKKEANHTYFLIDENGKRNKFLSSTSDFNKEPTYLRYLRHIGKRLVFVYKEKKDDEPTYMGTEGEVYTMEDFKKDNRLREENEPLSFYTESGLDDDFVEETLERKDRNLIIGDVEYILGNWYENKFGKFLIQIKKDDKIGLVDIYGKIVLPCEFTWINELYIPGKNKQEFLKFHTKNREKGIINLWGRIILEPLYHRIEYFEKLKLFYVFSSGCKGYASLGGKVFLPKECIGR